MYGEQIFVILHDQGLAAVAAAASGPDSAQALNPATFHWSEVRMWAAGRQHCLGEWEEGSSIPCQLEGTGREFLRGSNRDQVELKSLKQQLSCKMQSCRM